MYRNDSIKFNVIRINKDRDVLRFLSTVFTAPSPNNIFLVVDHINIDGQKEIQIQYIRIKAVIQFLLSLLIVIPYP